jgi:hypothetical protein
VPGTGTDSGIKQLIDLADFDRAERLLSAVEPRDRGLLLAECVAAQLRRGDRAAAGRFVDLALAD